MTYIASNVNWLDAYALYNLNDHIKHFYSASFYTWSIYFIEALVLVLMLKPFSSAWRSASSIWAKCLLHVWYETIIFGHKENQVNDSYPIMCTEGRARAFLKKFPVAVKLWRNYLTESMHYSLLYLAK